MMQFNTQFERGEREGRVGKQSPALFVRAAMFCFMFLRWVW